MLNAIVAQRKPLYSIPSHPHGHFPRSSLRATPILKLVASFLFMLYLALLSAVRTHILAAFSRHLAHHYYYHAPLLRQGVDSLLWTPLCYTGILFLLWVLSLKEEEVERALAMRTAEEEERLRRRWEEWYRKEQDNEVRMVRTERRALIGRGEWWGKGRPGGTGGVEVVKWFS